MALSCCLPMTVIKTQARCYVNDVQIIVASHRREYALDVTLACCLVADYVDTPDIDAVIVGAWCGCFLHQC